jgi:hypothetical protein
MEPYVVAGFAGVAFLAGLTMAHIIRDERRMRRRLKA